LISSIKDDPVTSLYSLISKVYVPLLRGQNTEKQNSLRDQLYTLRAILHSNVRKRGTNMGKL